MLLYADTRCAAVRRQDMLLYPNTPLSVSSIFFCLLLTHQLSRFLGQFLSQFNQEITVFFQILSKVKFSSVFPYKWIYSILDWKRTVSSDPFPDQHYTTKLQSLIIHHKIFHLKYISLQNRSLMLHGVIHSWKSISLATHLDTIV
jgi:hypothetical protein